MVMDEKIKFLGHGWKWNIMKRLRINDVIYWNLTPYLFVQVLFELTSLGYCLNVCFLLMMWNLGWAQGLMLMEIPTMESIGLWFSWSKREYLKCKTATSRFGRRVRMNWRSYYKVSICISRFNYPKGLGEIVKCHL